MTKDWSVDSNKNKEILHKLLQYGNQQVVMNWYEDEQLIAREGFFFSSIQIEVDLLIFIKNHEIKQKILLTSYETIEILPDFRDFFQLTSSSEVLHIYFPH